mmetsp:Transcript_2532/g.7506  ORF Transcript_2532/g.7506 Transcript_2532/m.7506 type:complete len:84 (+) Transcript_2532:519-770(+)
MPPAINYVYGAMAPRFWAYAAATAVGYLPGTLMAVLAAKGAALRPPPWMWGAGAAGAAALAATMVVTGRSVKRTLDEYERKLR